MLDAKTPIFESPTFYRPTHRRDTGAWPGARKTISATPLGTFARSTENVCPNPGDEIERPSKDITCHCPATSARPCRTPANADKAKPTGSGREWTLEGIFMSLRMAATTPDIRLSKAPILVDVHRTPTTSIFPVRQESSGQRKAPEPLSPSQPSAINCQACAVPNDGWKKRSTHV